MSAIEDLKITGIIFLIGISYGLLFGIIRVLEYCLGDKMYIKIPLELFYSFSYLSTLILISFKYGGESVSLLKLIFAVVITTVVILLLKKASLHQIKIKQKYLNLKNKLKNSAIGKILRK